MMTMTILSLLRRPRYRIRWYDLLENLFFLYYGILCVLCVVRYELGKISGES